jgi:hypothetical protein
LRPHLDEIGVGLVVNDEFDQIKEVFTEICSHVCEAAAWLARRAGRYANAS